MPWSERRGRGWIIRSYEGGKKVTLALCPDRSSMLQKLGNLEKAKNYRRLGLPNLERDLKECIGEYTGRIENEQTRALREFALNAFARVSRCRQLSDVTREKVLDWRDSMKKLAPNTVNLRMASLRIFLKAYEHPLEWRKGDIPRQKFGGRFLTRDQTDRIFEACPPELQRIFLLAFYTGMRPGEIVRATWEDLKEGMLHIPRTKTKVDRSVPILSTVLKPPKMAQGAIFPGWGIQRLRQAFRRAVRRAGFEERIRMHDLRHTFATEFLRRGGDIASLMAITGHNSLAGLRPYLHATQAHLKDTVQRLFSGHGVGKGPETAVSNDTERTKTDTMENGLDRRKTGKD